MSTSTTQVERLEPGAIISTRKGRKIAVIVGYNNDSANPGKAIETHGKAIEKHDDVEETYDDMDVKLSPAQVWESQCLLEYLKNQKQRDPHDATIHEGRATYKIITPTQSSVYFGKLLEDYIIEHYNKIIKKRIRGRITGISIRTGKYLLNSDFYISIDRNEVGDVIETHDNMDNMKDDDVDNMKEDDVDNMDNMDNMDDMDDKEKKYYVRSMLLSSSEHMTPRYHLDRLGLRFFAIIRNYISKQQQHIKEGAPFEFIGKTFRYKENGTMPDGETPRYLIQEIVKEQQRVVEIQEGVEDVEKRRVQMVETGHTPFVKRFTQEQHRVDKANKAAPVFACNNSIPLDIIELIHNTKRVRDDIDVCETFDHPLFNVMLECVHIRKSACIRADKNVPREYTENDICLWTRIRDIAYVKGNAYTRKSLASLKNALNKMKDVWQYSSKHEVTYFIKPIEDDDVAVVFDSNHSLIAYPKQQLWNDFVNRLNMR